MQLLPSQQGLVGGLYFDDGLAQKVPRDFVFYQVAGRGGLRSSPRTRDGETCPEGGGPVGARNGGGRRCPRETAAVGLPCVGGAQR